MITVNENPAKLKKKNNLISAIRVSIDQHACTLLSLRDNLNQSFDLKISWN